MTAAVVRTAGLRPNSLKAFRSPADLREAGE